MKTIVLILAGLVTTTLAVAKDGADLSSPIDLARLVSSTKPMITEDMIEGTWVGAWDGKWPVYCEIKKQSNPTKSETKFVSTYHWIERLGLGTGFRHNSEPTPVFVVNGRAYLSNIFLEPVPDQSEVILATGLFPVVRMTALYRANPAEIHNSAAHWHQFIERFRAGRRVVSRKESTEPILLIGYFSRAQTPKERATSGIDGCYVTTVMSGKSAQKAGMRAGDLVTEVNGQRIIKRMDQTFALRHEEGDKAILVTVWRNGAEVALQIMPNKRGRGPERR